MKRYSVSGRGIAPSAASEPHGVLWNASTTKTIYVVAVSVENSSLTVCSLALHRTSTKGTPTSTVTPDIDNDWDRVLAPQSGAVLDLADFTTVPTFQGPRMASFNITGTGAFDLVINAPIAVPQTTGLAVEAVAILNVMNIFFTWDE